MEPKVLTDEAVQIVGVARVVWDGKAAVTDGHLALTEGQREEAQLVQQTAECLEETWQVSQQDRGDGGHQKVQAQALTHAPKPLDRYENKEIFIISPILITHPDICLCSDDLVVVKVHHLWSAI